MAGFSNINDFFAMVYGTGGVDYQTLCGWMFGGASGLVFNGNPPYTVTDFFNFYPKFAGPPTFFSGLVSTLGSPTVTGFTSLVGLAVGQLVVDPAFPKDTLILSLGTNAITLSNNAISNGTTLTVFEVPFIPIIVVLSFVNLARASVMFQRYQDSWLYCMSLFIAHYCTMYLRTESGPNNNVSEVVSSGLTKGILISRHAGDVGASSQLIMGYQEWGAWGETQYGELFITIARATNCGPVFVQ